ncbi:dihydrodipicolinate synthase [Chlamydia ibidis]|uniref:4-hydroxy-tetrahydrodipicolinate synthase n=2 Tax=Chlamydia ibidis TaxID=1405396 RepID=S7KJW5_9CHLA|nr:4-hydroxy-tetrahydrodipicolinate synthase [Chlamydia ibidis]EPP34710.1 dihydrodipicolinate synthase [Chlamydia ibidis]EQM62397.1 dihydrodipicolinate synthase [Chlamydia ibidis 10-1398/6]
MKLLTASVTPFLDDHKIDFVSFRRLLFSQEESGSAIVVLGSTGENMSLTNQERRSIVDFTFSLGLKVPIVIGVPGVSLYESIEWVRFCNDYPIDAFLLTCPIYMKPGITGQTLWFETLLDQVYSPGILYNIPSRAGTPLYPETVVSLADHPKFLGIKDSGGSLEMFVKYSQITPHLRLYCGDDSLWPTMARLGAYGLVSVCSNAWPVGTQYYVKSVQDHQFQKEWQVICSWLAKTTNPIAIKAVLKYQKIITSSVVRIPLSVDDFVEHEHLPYMIAKASELSKVFTS